MRALPLRILAALLIFASSLAVISVAPTKAEAATPDQFSWSDVDPGKVRPTITIDADIYPQSAPDNRAETGVQFRINGRIDDRHPNRPNGWDATGPNEGSTFHVHPAISLRDGDTVEARWTDVHGAPHVATVVIGESAPPVPTPKPVETTAPTGGSDSGGGSDSSSSGDTTGSSTSSDVGSTSWSGVSAGDSMKPTLTVDRDYYPKTADDNSHETGVQFWINGSVDDRHPNRPNGWDATGPQEGSTFHMHPRIDLVDGDVLEARWIDRDGREHSLTHVVSGGSMNDDVVQTIINTEPEEETPEDREQPVQWSDGLEVGEPDAVWSGVFAGEDLSPRVDIAGYLYPKTALTSGYERGVQFLINGVVDDRSANRPNGWDSTGPLEGSMFSVSPRVELVPGDTLEARWVTQTGHSLFTTITVPHPEPSSPTVSQPAPTPAPTPEPTPTEAPTPAPTPEPEPTPDPTDAPTPSTPSDGSRGPSGQNWPSHTPAYTTPADIFVSHLSELKSALASASSGDVIEVAPHVYDGGTLTIQTGNDGWAQNVLIRPPLGQRQSVILNSSVILNAPHVTIAGFRANRTITLFDRADRSAWARIELGRDGFVRVRNAAPGQFLEDAGVYEIVAPTSRLTGDRMNLSSLDGGGVRRFTVSGVWLKGAYRPDGTSQHNDTLQVFAVNGGVGPEDLLIENSVFFASHSAAIALPHLRNTFRFHNSVSINCGYMTDVPITHECDGTLNLDIGVSPGVQVFITDSDLFGGVLLRQNDFSTTIQNTRSTVIKGPGAASVVDAGGNFIDSSFRDQYVAPAPPNLDAAWGN